MTMLKRMCDLQVKIAAAAVNEHPTTSVSVPQ
jgi:hypothetical protein